MPVSAPAGAAAALPNSSPACTSFDGRCWGGRSDGHVHVLEVLCGSAKLTATFEKASIPSLGVDRPGNPFATHGPWVPLDLVTRACQLQLLDLVADGSPVKLVWISWPCGAGTRAHNAPSSGERRALRSAREPRGRTDIEMSKEVKTRLEAENTLFDFGLELISHLDNREID